MSFRFLHRLRKPLLVVWLAALFSAIGAVFWYKEAVYSLPTPVPEAYNPVEVGTRVALDNRLPDADGKPVLIHFFNPDCPCSRFNIKHFQSLVKKYSNDVAFNLVVLNKEQSYTADRIRSKYNLDIPVLFDESIADVCGVYSTPQAVILDTDGRIFYRGNYNKARYCTDANSNYAQQALDALLEKNTNPVFSPLALIAYGCALPNCDKP